MADTLGSIIDKLYTVDMKLWNNQEWLYEIRRLSKEEFKNIYFNEAGMDDLWVVIQKTCDLNYQRNLLIDEIDEKIVDMINNRFDGKDLDEYVQRKHKTY